MKIYILDRTSITTDLDHEFIYIPGRTSRNTDLDHENKYSR